MFLLPFRSVFALIEPIMTEKAPVRNW